MQISNSGSAPADVSLLFTWAVSLNLGVQFFWFSWCFFNCLKFGCSLYFFQNSVGGESEFSGNHFNSKMK
jgi:hypothetical protein